MKNKKYQKYQNVKIQFEIRREEKLIPLTHMYTTAHFSHLDRHFNKKWWD